VQLDLRVVHRRGSKNRLSTGIVVFALGVAGCSSTHSAASTLHANACGGTWRDLLRDDERPTPTEIARTPNELELYSHKESVRDHVLGEVPGLVLTSVTVASDSPGLNAMLATQLQTAPGQMLDDAPIKDDMRRLWKLDVLDDIEIELAGAALTFVVTPHGRVGHVTGANGEALRRLALTSGAPFEPTRIARMADAARQVYVKDGHLDAAVDVYKHPAANGAMDLCVASVPGPRFTVGETRIVGATHVPVPELTKEMCEGNAKGDVLDESVAECSVLRVSAAYWDHGFANVKVGEPRYVRHASTIDIEIPITDEGPQFHYGSIKFFNGPPARNILRTGAMFSRSSLQTAIQGIQYQTGARDVTPFTHVDIADKRIDLTFEYSWQWPTDMVIAYLRGAK
jgi:outer membrane protein assembly factor BamA